MKKHAHSYEVLARKGLVFGAIQYPDFVVIAIVTILVQ